MTEIKSKRAVKALKISITVAIFLAIIKFIAGFFTHSMAIMASALDSLMDIGSSGVNLIAVKEASKPPDEEHTYGHGKIESLAGLFQSLLIGSSGLFLVFESGKRLFIGSHVEILPVGIGVMVISILASLFIVWVIKQATRESRSLVLRAERLHFAMDIVTNGGVIIALILVHFTHMVVWDLLVSIGIAIYVFKSAFSILRTSIDELLDKSLPQVSTFAIETIIRNHHPSIVGIHNFRSRRVGDKIFLDFHIEIRGEDDFKKAHSMTETLLQKIKGRFPTADITIHYDPEGED